MMTATAWHYNDDAAARRDTPAFSTVPTTSDAGVEGLWSFDAQNLLSVSGIGPALVSTVGLIGAPVETYIPGGIWIAPPL
jgi:hypothetical protein